MVIEGFYKEFKKISKIIKETKRADNRGQKKKLEEGIRRNLIYKKHLACIYFGGI